MKQSVFDRLCHVMCLKIGEETFHPKAWLTEAMEEEGDVHLTSGEVKVAVSLRLMAGGSHLDLVPLFGVSSSHLHNTFEAFLGWVVLSFEFPLVRWPQEQIVRLCSLANHFVEKPNGVFFGPFGTVDGLTIRFRCPCLMEVPDHGNSHCCKGFHALNAQAICDEDKHFLWCHLHDKPIRNFVTC